jgi:hypothetical protein
MLNDEMTCRYHDAGSFQKLNKRIDDQLYRKGYERLKVRLDLIAVNREKGTVTYRITERLDTKDATKAMPGDKRVVSRHA